jgi:hypothetical protein
VTPCEQCIYNFIYANAPISKFKVMIGLSGAGFSKPELIDAFASLEHGFHISHSPCLVRAWGKSYDLWRI